MKTPMKSKNPVKKHDDTVADTKLIKKMIKPAALVKAACGGKVKKK